MERKIDQDHEEDSCDTWSTKVEGEMEGETSCVSTQDLSPSIPPSNEELEMDPIDGFSSISF